VSQVDWFLPRYVKYWCLFLSWFLAVGIDVSSILVSTRCERDWCLLLSWCLVVGIGVSSILVSMNICKGRLVPTKICTSGDWCLQ
jgi:hypothetical protein